MEEKSISRAADRLYLRQPTVTIALKKLEETLGCQLIQRDSRNFVLTRQGEILRKECVEIAHRVEKVGADLSYSDSELCRDAELTGLINIFLVTHLPIPVLNRVMQQIRILYPSVTFQSNVATSSNIVRAIIQKYASFGFCMLQKPIPTLSCRYLYREHYGIYCGQGHRLYGQDDISYRDMSGEAFIALGCAEQGNTLEPMECLRASLDIRTIGQSENLEEVSRMIEAGMGIGLLPSDVVKHKVSNGSLWLLSTFEGNLGADVYLIQNPESPMNNAEKVFLDCFMNHIDPQHDDPVPI